MIIKPKGLVSGSKKPPTQYLVDAIAFNNIDMSANSVPSALGVVQLTPADGTFTAGTDTDTQGAITNKSIGDALVDGGSASTVWGRADISFIWAFKFTIQAAAPASDREILSCMDVANNRGVKIQVTQTGVLKYFYNAGINAATTGVQVVDDGLEHTAIFYMDRTGDDKLAMIIDGVEDSSRLLSAVSWLDDDTSPLAATNLTVFAVGATAVNQLFVTYPNTVVRDLEFYRITGNLTNKQALFDWINTHSGYPIPAELWS